ncbi:MAG: Crp/Fnr family transcriptional regulator [Betaproteobacteria bacterium]
MDVGEFNIPRFLAVLPLFNDLSAVELSRVALGCQVRRLGRGDTIFRYGEACEEFHVVVTGQVKLFALSPAGQEKIIELVGPGHSFAEALMFTDKPYILNAQALANTLLLTVAKQTMLTEIERDPRFSLRMLAGISRRLHGLVLDIESGALHSGMQRVIGYLLREIQSDDCVMGEVFTVSLPVSKATVASRLSLTPEYFSKVLHELEAEKLIEIDKRDIRIIDMPRLARYGVQ